LYASNNPPFAAIIATFIENNLLEYFRHYV